MMKEFKEIFDRIKPSKDVEVRLLEILEKHNNQTQKNIEEKKGE